MVFILRIRYYSFKGLLRFFYWRKLDEGKGKLGIHTLNAFEFYCGVRAHRRCLFKVRETGSSRDLRILNNRTFLFHLFIIVILL